MRNKNLKENYIITNKKNRDEFIWLENKNEKVKLWTHEQNEITDTWYKENCNKDEKISELKSKIKDSAYSCIQEKNNFLYARKIKNNGAVLILKLDLNFNEVEILYDTQCDGSFIYNILPSPLENNLIALYMQKQDDEKPSYIIFDTKAKQIIANFKDVFSGEWSRNGLNFIIAESKLDTENKKNINTVKSYNLKKCKTSILYEDQDNSIYSFVKVSDDKIFIQNYLSYESVKLICHDIGTGNNHLVNNDCFSNFSYIGTVDRKYYFISNCNSPNGRIIALDKEILFLNAETIIKEDNRILQGAYIADGNIICFYMNKVVSEIDIYNKNGKKLYDVELPDKFGSVSILSEIPIVYNEGTFHLYFQFQSFILPPTVLKLNTKKGYIKLMQKTKKILNTVIERKEIKTRDNSTAFVFLVYNKNTKLGKDTPALMYGYGGFGVSSTPLFNNPYMNLNITEWTDSGGLYIHCVIRGGGEFGKEWHEKGSKKYKINSIHDFIDIAEWVCNSEISSCSKLAILGGSNGGTLVLSSALLRPDLFKAVISVLPLTDLIRFYFDNRGPMYITEFGDPNDSDMLKQILKYSPYHNIRTNVEYPAMYLVTGEKDFNVPSYHSKKFLAKIKQYSPNTICLLRANQNAGHDLGSGEEFYNTCAEEILFIEKMLEKANK